MAGRQVLSDAGLSMPCILMNAATFVGHIGALGTYFLRVSCPRMVMKPQSAPTTHRAAHSMYVSVYVTGGRRFT
jgi:hypothetical protein